MGRLWPFSHEASRTPLYVWGMVTGTSISFLGLKHEDHCNPSILEAEVGGSIFVHSQARLYGESEVSLASKKAQQVKAFAAKFGVSPKQLDWSRKWGPREGK